MYLCCEQTMVRTERALYDAERNFRETVDVGLTTRAMHVRGWISISARFKRKSSWGWGGDCSLR